jgi:hypothetical protein
MTNAEADENERVFLDKCREELEKMKRQAPAPMPQYERD